jgi:hypothetical protein
MVAESLVRFATLQQLKLSLEEAEDTKYTQNSVTMRPANINKTDKVQWGRLRGSAAPMHLGRTNGLFVHRF